MGMADGVYAACRVHRAHRAYGLGPRCYETFIGSPRLLFLGVRVGFCSSFLRLSLKF